MSEYFPENTMQEQIEQIIFNLPDRWRAERQNTEVVFDTIAAELQKKEKVQIPGFGTFQTTERAARTGRNPRTGEELKIAASTNPSFKAGKALKELVNTAAKKKGGKKREAS